ncbi:MAG: heme-binding protein [SAR202 cluster bacterium]|nr:heme-binding protein [SAR202 cluster bacterium]
MLTKYALSSDQCQAAITAMLADFKKRKDAPPIAAAIVDDNGNLLAFTRIDGCRPQLGRNAIKKAYTAALTGMDSEEYAKSMKQRGKTVAEFGDPMLFDIPGGILVKHPKTEQIMGGIGVAGLPAGPGDSDVALAGLKAMGLDGKK